MKKISMKALFHQDIKLENDENQNIQQHVASSSPLIIFHNTEVIIIFILHMRKLRYRESK